MRDFSGDGVLVAGRLVAARQPAQGPALGSLLVLHGAGGTGASLLDATGLAAAAAAASWAVIAPDSQRADGWSDLDRGYLAEATHDLRASGIADDGGVVVCVGFSLGGGHAALLAAQPELAVAGVAVVASVRPVMPATGRPLPPLLAIHGLSDTVVPADSAGGAGELRAWCAGWAATAAAVATPRSDLQAGSREIWLDEAGVAHVTLITLAGRGHEWPVRRSMPPSPTSIPGLDLPGLDGVDANAEILAFANRMLLLRHAVPPVDRCSARRDGKPLGDTAQGLA
jgi:poly(3-hydroxybutyrate) depolymerase